MAVSSAPPRAVPPPRPGPPPQFTPGASAYPAHIQAAYDEASPEERARFDRAYGGRAPTTPVGFSAGVEDLDLKPSYPSREDDPTAPRAFLPAAPMAAPPPPAPSRREGVRALEGAVQPLEPAKAASLAELTARAAELTGKLHETFRAMTELLQAQVSAQAPAAAAPPLEPEREPEIPVVVVTEGSGAADPSEPEPLPGPPPPAGV